MEEVFQLHCQPQVANLLSRVQGAICRAARSNICTILSRLDEGLCWQGRHNQPEAVRGTGNLIGQVPLCRQCSLYCRKRGSQLVSFSRRCNARRSRGQGTGSWTGSWTCSLSRCWPPCLGHRALWCSKSECLLRIHSQEGQSVVLAALH